MAFLAVPVFGSVLAFVAELVQSYFAPLILFPLLLGVFAGVGVVALARLAQIGHRPTLIAAAVLSALLAGVGQHYSGYLSAYYGPAASVKAENVPVGDLSEMVKRATPDFFSYMQTQASRGRPLWADYMADGWVAWLSWGVDLLLAVLGAVAVIMPAIRVPYCNRCGTWYKTVRCRKIDLATARRIAQLIGMGSTVEFHSPRCRLSACHGGCGPTCCDLSWETTDGAVELTQAWLNAGGRNQVATVLDELEAEEEGEPEVRE